MPLYKKRISGLELRTKGLYDDKGEEVSHLYTQEIEVLAGGKKVMIRLSKDRSSIEIECDLDQKTYGSRSDSGFRILL